MKSHEIQQFQEDFQAIEGDLNRLSLYGNEALHLLSGYLAEGKPSEKTRAIRVCGLIRTQESLAILTESVRSAFPQVRSTISIALRDFGEGVPAALLQKLLSDTDASVRRQALLTTKALKRVDLLNSIAHLAEFDDNETVRESAVEVKEVLTRLSEENVEPGIRPNRD